MLVLYMWNVSDNISYLPIIKMDNYFIVFPVLLGVMKRDAQVLFIMHVYELENYGMTYVQAIINSERVRVGLGAKYIRLLTQDWRCKSR